MAVDQASVEMMNKQPGLGGGRLEKGLDPGQDKVQAVYPHINWTVQLDYGEQLGLGKQNYDLEWLPDKE